MATWQEVESAMMDARKVSEWCESRRGVLIGALLYRESAADQPRGQISLSRTVAELKSVSELVDRISHEAIKDAIVAAYSITV